MGVYKTNVITDASQHITDVTLTQIAATNPSTFVGTMSAWNELSADDKLKRHGSLVTITGSSTVGDGGSGAYYDNNGALVPLIDKGYASPISHTVVQKSVPIGHGDYDTWNLICIQLNIDTVKVVGKKFSISIGEVGDYLVENSLLRSASAYTTTYLPDVSTHVMCAFYGVNDTVEDAIGNGDGYAGQGIFKPWYLPNRLTAMYGMSGNSPSSYTPKSKEPDWCIANRDKIATFTITAANNATIDNNASYPFMFSTSYFHHFTGVSTADWPYYCVLNGYMSIDISGYNASAHIKCTALELPSDFSLLPSSSNFKYFHPERLTDGNGTRNQGPVLFTLVYGNSYSVTPVAISNGSTKANCVYRWSTELNRLYLEISDVATDTYAGRSSLEIDSQVR